MTRAAPRGPLGGVQAIRVRRTVRTYSIAVALVLYTMASVGAAQAQSDALGGLTATIDGAAAELSATVSFLAHDEEPQGSESDSSSGASSHNDTSANGTSSNETASNETAPGDEGTAEDPSEPGAPDAPDTPEAPALPDPETDPEAYLDALPGVPDASAFECFRGYTPGIGPVGSKSILPATVCIGVNEAGCDILISTLFVSCVYGVLP